MWLLILGLLLLPVLLVAIAIGLNRPPLFHAPGPSARLAVYLRENVAVTADQHPHAELITPTYLVSSSQLKGALRQAMVHLNWRLVEQDDGVIRAEVTTPLLHFVDDVEARVEAIDGGSRLHLRSASRVGRADFAANQRHLLDLLERLSVALTS